MGERPVNVLFLCTHNSARSVVAECVMNALGKGRFRGYSAGSQPSGRVNPIGLSVLKALGHDVSHVRSKSWEEFAQPDAPPMDFIFTVCDDAANETCPYWPGHPVSAHWGLPDPSRVAGGEEKIREAFAETHAKLQKRIGAFVALPFESLTAAELKDRLAKIGEMT